MLRALVLILLLANAALWAWREGWLGTPPGEASADREPQRLAQQIEPERLRLLNAPGQAATAVPEAPANLSDDPTADGADAAPQADAPPVSDTPPVSSATAAASITERRACWQLAALPPAQAEALRRSADGEPGLRGRSTEQSGVLPARWIVYLGKFPSAEALQRRRAALRQAGIDHREVSTPALAPGLALGTYSTEEAARRALQDAQRQGIGDARVVQERPETRVLTLRWPDLTAEELQRLRAALGPNATALAACP